MALRTSYYAASGAAFNDCYFLGQRYEEEWGYRPNEGESWILRNERVSDDETFTRLMLGTSDWLTGLWYSPAGQVYACDTDGKVHFNRRANAPDAHTAWEEHRIEASLRGIYGLDDATVFTWGQRRPDDHPVFRWDGARWAEMPNPGFDIRAMHGIAPDFVYAVGREGSVARWDGGRWITFPTPTREVLASVFVAGNDEMYAVGSEGSLLEGSANGWGKIAEGPGLPGPLASVCKWNGQVWVGAGRYGLLRRVGNTSTLEVVKENLWATDFDVRWSFVVSCEDSICGTRDGVDWEGAGDDVLLQERDGIPLLQF